MIARILFSACWDIKSKFSFGVINAEICQKVALSPCCDQNELNCLKYYMKWLHSLMIIMFNDTLCKKITFYLINNFLKNVFNNFFEKKSLKLILTRLGIFNFVLIIVEKELFENETDNSTTFFLISNILFKIVVNDLLNNQSIYA